MTTKTSSAVIDVDLDARGKQIGTIKLTHSDDRHGYSVIPVPIAVVAGSEGPSVMLSAGNHGDEYEGQIALQEFVRRIDPAAVRGRLFILPAFNYAAVMAASRVSPLDGGNLNRVFPGDPDAGPTSALAHFVATQILPRSRFAIDFHSAGKSATYLPCTYLHWGGDAAARRARLDGAYAFGAPNVVIAGGVANAGSMTAECGRQGITMVSTELGGAGTVTRATLEMARIGLRRCLAHWGVLAATDAPATGKPRLLQLQGKQGSVMVETDGLFEPLREPGESVAAGDLAGYVYPVGELTRERVAALFTASGVIVTRRIPVLVRRGDLLYGLASETSEAELGLG